MQRIPQLDGLRAIAILMVFLCHALNRDMLWAGSTCS
jgi:peptidoglycan/LPS O-acetylase OafA/YrhL